MVLKIFEKVTQTFMEYLKEINHRRNIVEQKLYDSNRNEELLELMRIQKSLVYFVTALRSNELLLMKLERTNFLGLNDEEKEFLNDHDGGHVARPGNGQYLYQYPQQHTGCICQHHQQ